MITGKQFEDAWGDEYRKGQSSSLAWEAVANLANKGSAVAIVPRIIFVSFWRTYFNWAEGLEKVLRSERVDPAGIAKRLDEEYAAACTRLTAWYAASYSTSEEMEPSEAAKAAAIPPRK